LEFAPSTLKVLTGATALNPAYLLSADGCASDPTREKTSELYDPEVEVATTDGPNRFRGDTETLYRASCAERPSPHTCARLAAN
jgi:hypothetical protein